MSHRKINSDWVCSVLVADSLIQFPIVVILRLGLGERYVYNICVLPTTHRMNEENEILECEALRVKFCIAISLDRSVREIWVFEFEVIILLQCIINLIFLFFKELVYYKW